MRGTALAEAPGRQDVSLCEHLELARFVFDLVHQLIEIAQAAIGFGDGSPWSPSPYREGRGSANPQHPVQFGGRTPGDVPFST